MISLIPLALILGDVTEGEGFANGRMCHVQGL